MKKGLTKLVAILDMSGSMRGLVSDTLGGYNAMLDEHRRQDDEVLVSTYLFNTDWQLIHDRVSIHEVEPLTENEYCPSGGTALLDAMGDAIHHITDVHRYIREEDVPENTIFIITTDGMENSSHKYSSDGIKRLVEEKQEKENWDFVYLASNIDAVDTARHYGFRRENCVDYMPDSMGTAHAYEAASSAVMTKKMFCSLGADPSWRKDTDEDFKSRHR